MMYVDLSQDIGFPSQRHIGVTKDLKARLKSRNNGQSSHPSKFKPWRLATFIAFSDDSKAAQLEKYLTSGSGEAFAEKRLWANSYARDST